MKKRITKRVVDATTAGPDGQRVKVYDDQLTGFGFTALASGKRSFFVEWGPHGQAHRMKIGDYGPLTVEDARKKAVEILAAVLAGRDPLEERKVERAVPTFKKWSDEYLAAVALRKKRPQDDRRYLKMACERWGARRITEITPDDVRRAFEAYVQTGARIAANRWLASVRACLQEAWRMDKIESNPAMKVRLLAENPPRSRVLSNDEYERVLKAIDQIEDPYVQVGFALLMETGARVSEVLRAQWADFDLDEALWRLPKTKSGREQILPLSAEIVTRLDKVPRLGDYVLPGRDPKNPRSSLRWDWEDLKKAAELGDVGIHDLRRTFGLQVAKAAGLHVASRLLRHSDIRVTERHYAPLGLADLRAALETRKKVVPMRKRVDTTGTKGKAR